MEEERPAERTQEGRGEKYGPWMTVKPRRGRQNNGGMGAQATGRERQNRFEALSGEATQEKKGDEQTEEGTRVATKGQPPETRKPGGVMTSWEDRSSGKEGREGRPNGSCGEARKEAAGEQSTVWKTQPSGAQFRRKESSLPQDHHMVIEIQDESTKFIKRARTPGPPSQGRPPDQTQDSMEEDGNGRVLDGQSSKEGGLEQKDVPRNRGLRS